MKDQWHKISSPLVESHFPCWLCVIETQQVHFWRTLRDMKAHEPLWSLYTHWMEATPDTLPQAPKKPDRDNEDHAACLIYFGQSGGPCGSMTSWHAALLYERSFIRHLIDRHKSGELPRPEVIRQITERVKL